VLLAIMISYYSLIDLPSLTKNKQVLTSKSFLIKEVTFDRKRLPQGIFIKKIWSRFQLTKRLSLD
jgi:hypothetical protein